jgi:hypothetical protein
MKKLIENDGISYFEYEYEGYMARVLVNDEKMTDLILYKPNGDELNSGPIYNDKHLSGLPITSYYKRKLKSEIVEIINEVLDYKDAILNGDESIIDEILES